MMQNWNLVYSHERHIRSSFQTQHSYVQALQPFRWKCLNLTQWKANLDVAPISPGHVFLPHFFLKQDLTSHSHTSTCFFQQLSSPPGNYSWQQLFALCYSRHKRRILTVGRAFIAQAAVPDVPWGKVRNLDGSQLDHMNLGVFHIKLLHYTL